jgi:hypothetical protein
MRSLLSQECAKLFNGQQLSMKHCEHAKHEK